MSCQLYIAGLKTDRLLLAKCDMHVAWQTKQNSPVSLSAFTVLLHMPVLVTARAIISELLACILGVENS